MIGRSAQARRDAGGPRVRGRSALSVDGWAVLCRLILLRCSGCCEFCGDAVADAEHAQPAGQGGADSWANVWGACRRCHEAKTFGHAAGTRLEIEPLGDGRFIGVWFLQGEATRRVLFGRPPTRREQRILEALR